MKFFLELIRKYRSVLVYLVFGILTTAVNYLIYLPCFNWFGLYASVSNAIAWVGAVIFAYLTNKPFVFESKDWSAAVVIPEFFKFVGTRVVSGGAEILILLVAVDWMGWNGNLWKLATSVLVVIVNYIGSKLIVFQKKIVS